MAPTAPTAAAPARTRSARPVPRDSEARFGIDELFFSTTDHKGRIRSGNQVFARTSGYDLDELVGQPHNLIRHPDMPRTAFRLLWRFLEDERPVAAYVKNLSKDGSYYWVLAFVVPAEGGYLSIRLKPTSPLFDAVRAIYAEMLAVEAQHEDGTREGREAGMDASEALLIERLSGAGFDGYVPFMHAALVQESASREEQLAGRVARGGLEPGGGSDPTLVRTHRTCTDLQDQLDVVIGNMREYGEINAVLDEKSRFVLSLAETIRVSSLNALLASANLGPEGAAIGAVASLMRDRSDAIAPVIGELDERFASATAILDDLAFRAAGGKLQTEMAAVFLRELAGGGQEVGEDLAVVVRCLCAGVERIFAAFAQLEADVATLLRGVARLESDLEGIHVLEVNGRVEGARLDGSGGTTTSALFTEIGERVRVASEEIGALKEATRRLASHDRSIDATVRRQLEQLREQVGIGEPLRSVSM